MDISFIPGIQLDVINAKEMADGCATLELVLSSTLCDDLTEAYAEQQ